MRLSLGVRARSAAMLRELADVARAEALDRVWVYDSGRCIEAIASMAFVASEDPARTVGVAVANTETRHLAVLANAIATISNLSGGRVVLGLGRGDSALKFLGLRPTPLAELERRVVTLRALLDGEPVEFGGRRFRLPDPPRRHVPILLSVEGPRTCELAGRLADGAIVPMAARVEALRSAADLVRDAASKAGRDPSSLEVCGWLHGGCGPTDEAALEAVLPEVGRSLAAAVLARSPAWHEGARELDANVRARIAELAASQEDERRLGREVLDVAGESLFFELTIAGTAVACRDKVAALAQVPGVTELAFNVYPPDASREFCRAVLGPFRGPPAPGTSLAAPNDAGGEASTAQR
ncbi:MAG TPA: LLM class flavin-dependent oxidoreductase [Acidimicrobiales bacterium]|jgi:alkanesulfonate monooxygenase SsuD/methylene tetrahydromethanopterin reductase-like flavin-dependent oxidoreductase (luciferase family)|nr:LLM class flavin-dependent oxidoreductase [Acidimicrobiales bacterium]